MWATRETLLKMDSPQKDFGRHVSPLKNRKKKKTFRPLSESESRWVVSDSVWPHGLSNPWNSPGQNTGVGSLSLLQVMFPNQGLNPGLLHCRQSLYQLSHKGSPRILEWVAYPFSLGSSQPRNQTRISCIAGKFFPAELPGKAFVSPPTKVSLLNSEK